MADESPKAPGRSAKPSVAELLLRGEDFQVFVEEILGVKLNRAQRRIARVLLNRAERRKWSFKELVVVAANQIGKTLIEACIILWACTYKIGVDPEDMAAWARAPYLWIHLGPVQQQAYHAYKDAKMLIRGEHPAQGDRCKLPKGLIYEIKIENYYDGFEFFNGAQVMFRTGERKAEAVLGYRAAGISVDEAAFVDYLTEVKDTVLMLRLIASGGPILMFSTPNGMNDFFDQADAIKANGDTVEDMVWQWGGSFLVWAVITDNLGYGLDQAEIDRMEEKLHESTREQQLRGAFLNPVDAFFVPQDDILKAFRANLPHEVGPIPGHWYAEFWDPSVASDPTACIVLDVTRFPWQGVYLGHWERPLHVLGLIGEMIRVHGYYHGHFDRNVMSVPSRAVMGFDATSMGGAVMRQLLTPVNPKRPINMAGAPAKKVQALTNLRDRLTKGEIILPASWIKARQQVVNYKLKDDKIQQDIVMALMGADMVATSMTMGFQQRPVHPEARITKRKELRWR